MTLIQTAVLALVAVALGLFVIRPMVIGTSRAGALPAPAATLALPGYNTAETARRVLTGEIDDGANRPALNLVNGDDTPADPISRLRRMIEDRQAESVAISVSYTHLDVYKRQQKRASWRGPFWPIPRYAPRGCILRRPPASRFSAG